MNRWTEQVDVPVIWTIAAGQTPPQLCAWHGEPAEEMRAVRFCQKKVPAWLWISVFSVGLVAGLALGLIMACPWPCSRHSPGPQAAGKLQRRFAPRWRKRRYWREPSGDGSVTGLGSKCCERRCTGRACGASGNRT